MLHRPGHVAEVGRRPQHVAVGVQEVLVLRLAPGEVQRLPTTTSTPSIASSCAPAVTASVSDRRDLVGEWWITSRLFMSRSVSGQFSCGTSVLPARPMRNLDYHHLRAERGADRGQGPSCWGLSKNLIEEGILVEHRGELRDALTARLYAVNSCGDGSRVHRDRALGSERHRGLGRALAHQRR